MKRLRIRHVTGYRYEEEITASYNEARMLPSTDGRQLVLDARLQIAPVTSRYTYQDYWGTTVVAFDALTSHRELSLTASSLVEALDEGERTAAADPRALGWPELASTVRHSIELLQFERQTALTEPSPDVLAAAHEIAGRCGDAGRAALEICQWVGRSIEYVPGVTGVHSTAIEAWEARRGVCQDIAHVAIGALRSIGLPARYVSGYLHPSLEPVIGECVAGESHAWVEWFDGAWRSYDATNTVPVSDRHVSVGRGRDYDDVPPLRGVFAGTSGSELFVTVEITCEA